MAPNYSKFVTKKTVISAAAAVSVILWYLRAKKSKKRTRFVCLPAFAFGDFSEI